MSARTIRRAAERKAAKLAAKAGIQFPTANSAAAAQPVEQQQQQEQQPLTASASVGASFGFEQPSTQSKPPVSDAKMAANKANAQHSTGAKTAAGRAVSSMNAIKTGLTSRTVLLPTEDAVAYQQHLDREYKRLAPTTDEEKSLAQSIADTNWRILRIVPLEASIWAVALIKMGDLYSHIIDPGERQCLINGEIQLAYRKDLSNLALQERRLRNQAAADEAKLNALREAQRAKHDADFKEGLALYKMATRRNLPFHPAKFGFVFSIEEMELFVKRQNAEYFISGSYSEFNQEKYIAFMTEGMAKPAA
jgi:hypothetical protein